MKKLCVALFVLIFFSCKESGVDLGKPSTFVRYFNGGFPDEAQSIIKTSDGGYLILANSRSTLTSTNHYRVKLIKTDAYGNEMWKSLFPVPADPNAVNPPPPLSYRGFDVTAITDNSGTDTGYLIVGDQIYIDSANNDARRQALLMIQVDNNGQASLIKRQTYATVGVEVQGLAVTRAKTPGNFYILGQALTGVKDMFLTEVNASLTPLWTRTYGDASTELANRIFTNGDSIYWGGTMSVSPSLMRWEKSLVNSAAESNITYPSGATAATSFSCNDICRFGFGYGLVGSYSISSNQYSRIAFYRIDAGGHAADSATYALKNPQSFPAGNSITATNDGGFLILGTVSTDAQDSDANYYLLKIDSHGAVQWDSEYGGKFLDIGSKVIQANDGGYIVLGTTTLANVQSIFLMKTDSQGKIQ